MCGHYYMWVLLSMVSPTIFPHIHHSPTIPSLALLLGSSSAPACEFGWDFHFLLVSAWVFLFFHLESSFLLSPAVAKQNQVAALGIPAPPGWRHRKRALSVSPTPLPSPPPFPKLHICKLPAKPFPPGVCFQLEKQNGLWREGGKWTAHSQDAGL